ncbi:bacillithiol biosynthesis deacetylase BshB1 [Gorillibacterium massiliense]|uniref:bacillithiol biosynthesis deacetylase BshB1 n=1 Tax=Gorillibacterium massiliense TaxID=1280390 RepID=UPI0004ACB0D6|nr:bacillithiol biosynthesis deacetylase BshB1 [Gorillibacterium massiliense]
MNSSVVDILVIAAHADDAEIGMGGTIAKHVRAGYRVGICDLTEAELSSNGSVQLRHKEAAAASEKLGIVHRSNLMLPDRGLDLSPAQIEIVAMEIRRLRPRIVFAPYWEDRHPDHIRCSQLVQEAVFTAKLRRLRPEIAPVTVEAQYFYFINDIGPADLLVDVTSCYEEKLDALRSYSSQFDAADDQADTVPTPLNQGYLERVEARDRVFGMKGQVRYAEGFITKVPYQVDLFGRRDKEVHEWSNA